MKKREILFRGKTYDTREWVYGFLIYDEIQNMSLPHIGYLFRGDDVDVAQVRPSTVGQYTGITDKNDVKIFEGDIIRSTYNDKPSGPDCGIGPVSFYMGMWYVEGDINNSLYDIDPCNELEVIGNIHDNPELLEEE